MKKALSILGLLYIFLMISGCNAIPQQKQREANLQMRRVTVNGIDITNLARGEAEVKLAALEQNILGKEVRFTYQDQEFRAPLRDLGVSTNLKEVLDKVYGPGGSGKNKLDLKVVPEVDEKQAKAKIDSLVGKINSPAKDAEIKAAGNNTADIVPHVVGKEVNLEQAVRGLKSSIVENRDTVPLEVTELQPQVKTSDLEGLKFDSQIASFGTNFAPDDKNRADNLQKAAKALDGLILKPGEVFSFNKVVGPRTVEAGYKEAPVIVENQLVPGEGGGVCQVSSTLYNLALLGDLEIVERHPHEFAVAYLDPGRDATVVYPNIDLKFKNNTPGFLLIRTEVKGSQLNMTLFGRKSNKSVEIRTVVEDTQPFQTEKRFDASLPPGKVVRDQAGAKGYKVKTYRIVKVNGQVTKEEEISNNSYKPAKRIIRIGPPKNRGAAAD